MRWLLDSSVIVPLTTSEHLWHARAEKWFAGLGPGTFATCPITELAVLRVGLQVYPRLGLAGGLTALEKLRADPRHEFWPDDLELTAVRWTGVIGHRQVTDAYLASLARAHGGRLATLDAGLAALHPDVADLLP